MRASVCGVSCILAASLCASHLTIEFKHDGSTHLVNPAQYDNGKPFAAPPIALDAVSNLLEKVLATAGAHEPARDSVDEHIVKSVRDKTGTSRVKGVGPWPVVASATVPPTDSDHDYLNELAGDLIP